MRDRKGARTSQGHCWRDEQIDESITRAACGAASWWADIFLAGRLRSSVANGPGYPQVESIAVTMAVCPTLDWSR
jgi:hypothetical protein